VQNAKVKMREKDTTAYDHVSILQFEIYNLHFALAPAKGRTMPHGAQQERAGEAIIKR
jgi:hypothetical protein